VVLLGGGAQEGGRGVPRAPPQLRERPEVEELGRRPAAAGAPLLERRRERLERTRVLPLREEAVGGEGRRVRLGGAAPCREPFAVEPGSLGEPLRGKGGLEIREDAPLRAGSGLAVHPLRGGRRPGRSQRGPEEAA